MPEHDSITKADSHPPADYASDHTDGTDDIQNATAAEKGLATAAQITKLDGIASGADATPDASTTTKGKIEIATQGEVDTGTDTVRAVTPDTLANYSGLGGGGGWTAVDASETVKGIAELATQAETNTGTDDVRIVTPLKLATNLALHTGDATDAHDASAISFSPAGTIAATDVQAAIEEVASEAGGGSSASLRNFVMAYSAAAPSTPGSTLYMAGRFVTTIPNLRCVGAIWRDTVNGVSYTMTLRATNVPGTILATKAFTGTGNMMRVRFDSAYNMTANEQYEVGISAASAANMRYINTGGSGTTLITDLAWQGSVTSTDATGQTSRTQSGSSTATQANMSVQYEEY